MTKISRTVLSDIETSPDRHVHVSRLETDDSGAYLDIREYIPTLDQYGRGITLPIRYTQEIIDALDRAF
jgi:hypothetical protein